MQLSTHRLVSLDGIRALAVLAVLGFHARILPFGGGFVGVDVFFVLSGFLITSLLLEEHRRTGAISLWGFYARRMVRLWPALLVMLAVYVVTADRPDALREAASAALYVSNYSLASTGFPDRLSHTWSLAVEAQFYLLWPFVVAAVARWQDKQLLRLFVCAYLALTLWRMADLALWFDWRWTYYRFDTHSSGLMLGAAAAVAVNIEHGLKRMVVERSAFTMLALAVAIDIWKHPAGLILSIPAAEAAALLLILSVRDGQGEAARLLSSRPLVYLGTISYGIYLWHYPIMRVLRPAMDPWLVFVIGTAAAVGLAALSWRYLEKPLLARSRHQASRSSAASRFTV